MINRLFLLDIDDTLFDTARLKKDISDRLLSLLGDATLLDEFWQLNRSLRNTPFHVQNTIKNFCEKKGLVEKRDDFFHAFLDHDFATFLYPDVHIELPKLKELGTVALFSTGDGLFQQVKVQQSGLANLVNYAFIYDNKMEEYVQLLQKFDPHESWYMDNQHELLELATQLHVATKTVWIQRNPLEKTSDFVPTLTITSLTEFTEIIKQKNN